MRGGSPSGKDAGGPSSSGMHAMPAVAGRDLPDIDMPYLT